MGVALNLQGLQFGRLTAVVRVANDSDGHCRWSCSCQCGKTVVVSAHALRSGNTTSCGCAKVEATIRRSTRHGHAKRGRCTTTYTSWQAMRQRCLYPKDRYFPAYGGRGITICPRWLESFANFLSDMGPRPAGLSLDRKDNNGSYCPENCRWADGKTQARNSRNKHPLTYAGNTQTLAAWSETCGVSAPTIRARLSRLHWSTEKALTTPVRRKKSA